MNLKQLTCALAILLMVSISSHGALSPLASFGTNGWLAPTLPYLGTASFERGMAYNPVTGNLVVVSRNGAASNPIQKINGTTGADLGNLNLGSMVITGGTFTTNMVGIADDGAIYVGNLSTSATSNFKVYRWNDESASPTVAFEGASGLPRTGDTLDVFGAGSSTKIVASGGGGSDGFTYLSTSDGLTYAGGAVNVPGDAVGDYRLGLSFTDSDSVVGTQGTSLVFASVAGPTLDATGAIGTNDRPLDYAVVGGVPVVATVEAQGGTSFVPTVRVWDVSNPALPVEIANGLTAMGPHAANGNGAGQVKFGAITGNSAVLYAMSTNTGIQAFTFVVPEPGSFSLLGLAAIFGLGLRKRS